METHVRKQEKQDRSPQGQEARAGKEMGPATAFETLCPEIWGTPCGSSSQRSLLTDFSNMDCGRESKATLMTFKLLWSADILGVKGAPRSYSRGRGDTPYLRGDARVASSHRKAGIETARINQEHESTETSVLKETKTMLTIRRVMHQRGRGQDEGAKMHVCPEGSWSLYAWLRCACTYLGMPMYMCAHACKNMYPCVFAFGSICENGWGSVKYWNHYSKLQCFLTKVITLGNFQKPGCCCVDSWFG